MSRRRISKRMVLASGSLLCASAAAAWLFWDPSPTMNFKVSKFPPVNALDRYRELAGQIKDSQLLYSFQTGPTSWDSQTGVARTEMAVAKNRDVIQQILETESVPLRYPDPQSLTGKPGELGDEPLRDVARLLFARADSARMKGDADEALLFSLALIKLGCQVGSDGPLRSSSLGYYFQTLGRRIAWFAVPQASAQQAKKLASELTLIEANGESFKSKLQRERQYALSSLSRWWEDRDNRVTAAKGILRPAPFTWIGGIKLALEKKQEVLDAFDKTMNQWEAKAERAYRLRLPLPDNSESLLAATAILVDAWSWHEYTLNSAQNRLLAASLAARAYQVEKGRQPRAFGDLVPAYLPIALIDPFDGEAPIKLASTKGGLTIYSIGPDATDDGGKPIGTVGGPYRGRVSISSVGDIVAALNPR